MTDTTQQDQQDGTTPEAPAEEAKPVYDKGTWQEQMQRSASLLERSTKARRTASNLLWTGAQSAIEEWLPGSDSDVSGESLSSDVLAVLGKSRKGDVSKIKTVALAVKDHGLVLSVHPNLAKAYAEAKRLTTTLAAQAAEDDAAEKAIEALAENVPNSTTTAEGAALILLGKGIDGAVVAILDALGAKNFEAHRSFIRAVSTEVSARVTAAKPKPVKKAATPKGTAKKATPAKSGAAKAKPAGTKAKPVKKAAPAAKAKPVSTADKGAPVSEPVEGEQPVSVPEVPVKKSVPVVVKR